ncbi:acyltransferase family protein [Pseudomonas frederiksbergensis]
MIKISPAFSVYLDFLRVFAAFTVVVSHYPIFLWQAEITSRYNFGYDAVVVFFVLSGYVISYAADQIERTWFNYVVSRAARILPVSTVAVFVSLALMYCAYPYGPEAYLDASQLKHIPSVSIVTIFFANEFWWSNIRPFGNGPYWSLAFEVWCYVIYGLAIFFARSFSYFLDFAGAVSYRSKTDIDVAHLACRIIRI